MTEKPEASVLTARRAAQHFRLSSADDACEHLYILIMRSSLGPSPPNAGRYTVASRFRCRSCERGYIFPRAPEQFVTSPLCLVGYVRWDARSDRVPPLQTIIFSSFPGRTPASRLIRWDSLPLLNVSQLCETRLHRFHLEVMISSCCIRKVRKNLVTRHLPGSRRKWRSRAWPSPQE